MPTVNIHIYEAGSLGHNDFVYCGRNTHALVPSEPYRSGWLGNPVKIKARCPECGQIHRDGGSTLPCYTKYLWRRLQEPEWALAFYNACYGKVLGCFCKPKPCHTDVMIRALNWLHIHMDKSTGRLIHNGNRH